ncbi:carbohydrate ABC transporter permease [Enterocloster citroniae]|uniref:carbohydrate ABC transporter permease n=1 Tax=Enterocloster citroniae TaxID=358743 RepID=UPI0008E26C67|nr:carbohydrate ABC transporter permease [Enterocloster citroniae]SFS23611.1 carbohydrate ABC transporter membrane protein 2, CUT1 family [Enterocloster citroniae]
MSKFKSISNIKRSKQFIFNTILILVSLIAILPLVLILVASFTDNKEIITQGYSFFPKTWSIEAYAWIWRKRAQIVHSLYVTVVTTAVGTGIGLSITILLAYVLSQEKLPGKRFLSFFVLFTMLFSGGLVPLYFVYTQVLKIKNTMYALIVPNLLMSAFHVMITRTFFTTTVPQEILEAARIDGAGEWKIFIDVVLPISKPILATITMLKFIDYFNSWYNSMVFITNDNLNTLQSFLSRTLLNLQYLASSTAGAVANSGAVEVPMESVRMAMAVIGAVPLLIAYPFFQKYFVGGLTVGSVKG